MNTELQRFDYTIENATVLINACYVNGTSVEIPGDSSGGVRDGMYVDSFVDVGMTGEVLRTDGVKSITISGTEIELK